MKTIRAIILFIILLGGRNITAQTLQQVTDNGATTSNGISVALITANSSSFAGATVPTHINMLEGYRINGSIANTSHNGITYQSGGGGGAAIGFFRDGSYGTGLDFYTNYNGAYGDFQHRMRIGSNGNIGIGTTNPLANLHVIGAIRWGGEDTNYLYTGQDVSGAYFEQVGTDADKSRIRFQTSKNGSGSNYAQLLIDPENGFSFLNLGAASSNVGIGTKDTKGYKLAVAGNMIAESIKVQLQGSWSDFVFADDYKLLTLQQTEQHIKEKGHLPGIPSAAEVKANGIDLGEMNVKLLQKIEELTLHLIKQEKDQQLNSDRQNSLIKKLIGRLESLERKSGQ
ncbi:hypothetical protein [Pedobacter heparinus]|uniref:hypothetical protein n=1 Tax=Pedobacter heparinus TaxID=984 RepID=UPI00292D7F7B|nr:hypothetical protein [Pedobacter heparinus]